MRLDIDLPYVDGPVPSMLRLLHAEDVAAVRGMPHDERVAVFSSLALTVMRATYHRLRFDAVVDHAKARADEHPDALVMDSIAKYAIFEALGLLVAARTAVDEIAFIGARRSGAPVAEADGVNVTKLIRTRGGSAELSLVGGNYGPWFEDINEYRNALAHRGHSERLGIHAPDSPHAEARDPEWNALLVPDRTSVVRPKRPHEWTYTDKRRLEELVASAHQGLLCVVQEIASSLWGAAAPAPGTQTERLRQSGPAMLVVRRPGITTR